MNERARLAASLHRFEVVEGQRHQQPPELQSQLAEIGRLKGVDEAIAVLDCLAEFPDHWYITRSEQGAGYTYRFWNRFGIPSPENTSNYLDFPDNVLNTINVWRSGLRIVADVVVARSGNLPPPANTLMWPSAAPGKIDS